MEQNIERASSATGTLNQQQAIYAESVEAHLQKLSTEAEKTYSLLFDEDALKSSTEEQPEPAKKKPTLRLLD